MVPDAGFQLHWLPEPRSFCVTGSWTGSVLQLIEIGAESLMRSIDVLESSRPRDRRGIASLGLTLLETKQLLARVQQRSRPRKPLDR